MAFSTLTRCSLPSSLPPLYFTLCPMALLYMGNGGEGDWERERERLGGNFVTRHERGGKAAQSRRKKLG